MGSSIEERPGERVGEEAFGGQDCYHWQTWETVENTGFSAVKGSKYFHTAPGYKH